MSIKKANAVANAFVKANSNSQSKKGKPPGPPGGEKSQPPCKTCGQDMPNGRKIPAEKLADLKDGDND